VEDEKVILIKLYKVSTTTFRTTSSKMTKTSFIYEEIKNLEKYMKFVHFPAQTRIFKLLPHYQSLCFIGEQNFKFWRKIAVAFVKEKHNIETSWNGYPISIYQGSPSYKPYFIAIDNRGQAIIGLTKKIVVIHMIGELEVLIWFMWTWNLKRRYYYNWYLIFLAWTRAQNNNNMIGCTKVVSVSTSCSRCYILALFTLFYDSVTLCIVDLFLVLA